jgi:hypothetical protein
MKTLVSRLSWRILLIGTLMFSYKVVSATVFDVGAGYTCGIQSDNTAKCSGWWSRVGMKPVKDTLSQISVGYSHACGIRTDDQTVVCWAGGTRGEAIPPSGRFSQVSAGGFHTCGISTDDQTVACWGSKNGENDATDYGQASPPSGTFSQVSAGRWYTCGIRTDKTVACWGLNRYGEAKPPEGSFSHISAAKLGWHTCGIKADNTMACWGLDDHGQATPPEGRFSQVSAGKWYTCGIRADNHALTCWGNNSDGQADSPSGSFSYVSAGLFHTCALQTNLTPLCWGYDIGGSIKGFSNFIPVKSADDYVCFLYVVLDKGLLFTIDSDTFGVNVFGNHKENPKLQAMDIHPLTNQLYAVSRKNIYKVDHPSPIFTDLGEIDTSVEGLTFHPDGTLWGWASKKGLLQIQNNNKNEPNPKKIKVVLPYSGKTKIEDITWNNTGTIIYGVENLYEKQDSDKDNTDGNQLEFKGARLFAYDASEESVSVLCDELMGSLKTEVTALETQTDDRLLLGFRGKENLTFGVIDVQTCEMTAQMEAPSDYSDIKSIAWPDCSHGDVVK